MSFYFESIKEGLSTLSTALAAAKQVWQLLPAGSKKKDWDMNFAEIILFPR